jgi:hypothetical protein
MILLKLALGADMRDPLSTDLNPIAADSHVKRETLAIVEQTKAVQELARRNAQEA